MKKTTIKRLPLDYDREYVLTINTLYDSSFVVSIDGRKYYISIPKNRSWIGQTIYEGLTCIISKVHYGDRGQYAKLNLVEIIEDSYYEKENNHKETTTYSNTSKYYEILQCNVDCSLETIKSNYRKLIRQYHYDTLASKDLPEDMLEYAQNKAKAINEAYEKLKSI